MDIKVNKPLAIYEDERGVIFKMTEDTLFITSEVGAVRAQHWHKNSGHSSYLTYGRVEYFERPVGDKGKPQMRIIGPFEIFHTEPNTEHAMKFTEKSGMVVLSTKTRAQDAYENDLVRLTFDLTKE